MKKNFRVYRLKIPIDINNYNLDYLTLFLDDEELSIYNSYKKYKYEYLLRKIFVKYILSINLDIDIDEIHIKKDNYGKAKLIYQNNVIKDISISKTNGLILFGISNFEGVGLDVEIIKEIEVSQFKSAFSSVEYTFINKGIGGRLKQRRFYYLWTRKEAFSKLLGKGFYIEPKYINVNIYNDWGNNIRYFTYQDSEWMISICYKTGLYSNDITIDNFKVGFSEIMDYFERRSSNV